MHSNNNLPIYFSNLSNVFSEEVLKLLTSIENSFNQLEYIQHKDDIDLLFSTIYSKPTSEFGSSVMEVYREHINSVLSLQGIFLANPYIEELATITTILHTVSILATVPLNEVLLGETIDDENSDIVYFASVIKSLTDLTIETILNAICDVSKDTINFLHNDTVIPFLINNIDLVASKRFKESNIPKRGIIVEAIRQLNTFGYNVNTFLLTHSHLIAEHESNEELVNEIILLVLGSDVNDKYLLVEALRASEHILRDNPNRMLMVNILLEKYFKVNN